MALNIPQQPNIPNTADAQVGLSPVLDKIKELFVSPLTITIVILAFIVG